MSVIITGMDMPENCIKCNSMNCFLPYKKNTNREVVKKKYMTVRHEDCPLKSVDELIELIESDENITTFERFMTMGGFKFKNMIPVERAIDIIKEYCGMEDNDDTDNKV